MDMQSMRVIASDSLGDGPDVLAFDEGLGVLYVASESGVLSMFKLEGKTLKKLGHGSVARKAHTVAVDSETHFAYFPIENLNGKAVLRITEPASG